MARVKWGYPGLDRTCEAGKPFMQTDREEEAKRKVGNKNTKAQTYTQKSKGKFERQKQENGTERSR
jgi:hypothetical protein